MKNTDDSEDVLQDSMLSAFLKLHQFQRRAKFSTWMHSIVVNTARMHLRRLGPRHFYSLDEEPLDGGSSLFQALPDPGRDAEQTCIESERSRILRDLLRGLRPAHRSVIELCDIEGLNGPEAAAKLGISIPLLKTNLHRARRLIARKVRERCRLQTRRNLMS